MILVYDPPCGAQARWFAVELRSMGVNIIAVSLRTLSGPNQSRWLAQADQMMLLCHPSKLGALSSDVQKEYMAWREVYKEDVEEEGEE